MLLYEIYQHVEVIDLFFNRTNQIRRDLGIIPALNSRSVPHGSIYYSVNESNKIIEKICLDNNIDYPAFLGTLLQLLQNIYSQLVLTGTAIATKQLLVNLLADASFGDTSEDPLATCTLVITRDVVPAIALTPTVSVVREYSFDQALEFGVEILIGSVGTPNKRLNPLIFLHYIENIEKEFFGHKEAKRPTGFPSPRTGFAFKNNICHNPGLF